MVLKIRLARFGRRHNPFYNIVVAHARTARNSKPLEVIGTYNPIPQAPPAEVADTARKFKDVRLDTQRVRYWLGVGAQPSDPAWRLLSMVGLLEPKYRPDASTGEFKRQDRKRPIMTPAAAVGKDAAAESQEKE